MKYCYKCLHENKDDLAFCKNCNSDLLGFFKNTYKISKEYSQKTDEFWRSKDYANYIYAAALTNWYHAIAISIRGNKIKAKDYTLVDNPIEIKSFKKLNKENNLEIWGNYLYEIYSEYEPYFHYIFKVSDFYQNPIAWSKNNKDRTDPNDFIKGESISDRTIRLISKDKKCILAIRKLLSVKYKNIMRSKLKELLI